MQRLQIRPRFIIIVNNVAVLVSSVHAALLAGLSGAIHYQVSAGHP
jgi:hypothetical protein